MEMEKFEYRFELATGTGTGGWTHGWVIYSTARLENVKLQEVARCWRAGAD